MTGSAVGLRLAGKQPAVDLDLAEARDHVPLLRGARSSSATASAPSSGSRSSAARSVDRARELEHLARRAAAARRRSRRAPSTSGSSCGSGSVRGEPLDQRRRLDERVVGDPRHRRVAAAPVHAEDERRAHLLGGRAEVERRGRRARCARRRPRSRRTRRARRRDARGRATCSPKSSPTSSSAAATKIRSPSGSKPSRASDAMATALAATWPFMSSAPRPQTSPSRSSPDHGSTCHSAGSATTVSVWESSSRPRPAAPARDSRDEVRPLGHPRVQLALDAVVAR